MHDRDALRRANRADLPHSSLCDLACQLHCHACYADDRVSDGRLLRQRGAFNELRSAGSLAKRESAEARVFLTIDADKVLLL
jgi:hypothetical protein